MSTPTHTNKKTTNIKQLYKDNTETWGNADLVNWQWQMCAHCKTHTCNHPQTPPKRAPSQTSRPEAQFPYCDRAHTLKKTPHFPKWGEVWCIRKMLFLVEICMFCIYTKYSVGLTEVWCIPENDKNARIRTQIIYTKDMSQNQIS